MIQDYLLKLILSIPGILLGFAFHEYAHAKVADKLGDKTPRFEGRLTLNPLAHIDIIGFIMIVLFGFGWAKPVTVNKRAFKNYYKDDLKVSAAGPLANLVLAFILTIVLALFQKYVLFMLGTQLALIIYSIIYKGIYINIGLCIFNLLPLPGLDGLSILQDYSPKTYYKYANQLYRYEMPILLIAIAIGGRILYYPTTAIGNLFSILVFSVIR
ncbi:site-2 protease family protein [Inconstantimicrobium mannanitabidum]|uniref:Metalloprotease n=1 Tax=Inconstantimicrobium mannanitabidum TaxID=1604901 RepID=A0ACB5RDD7_9CLOT|nr:site-2 protease family protein [Clostridium sp. TW13]GKX66784.1 metalloprotease [Clostridium sp. TW13]